MDKPKSASLQATEDYSADRATAPRVSLQSMEDKIEHICFVSGADAALASGNEVAGPSLKLLTLCLVTMKNGFVLVGKSAPASAENFDAEKGKLFAYEDAIKQLWPLEGYALRERLADA